MDYIITYNLLFFRYDNSNNKENKGEKMKYTIINEKDNKKYIKKFKDSFEARHWIINTLDLSKKWSIHKL